MSNYCNRLFNKLEKRNMHPIAFHLFGRPIYWYGIMVATGYVSVVAWWAWLARREKRAEGFASELAFWLMVSGIAGARLAYVLANWKAEFAGSPLAVFRIDQGGLVYYGGFLGGLAGFLCYARFKRLNIFSLGDFALSGLPLGHAFGRVGCLLNGCCYGRACASCGVLVDGVQRIPVQLYEALFNFALFALMALLYLKKERRGRICAAYFLLYPAGRFTLEFWRGDERLRLAALSLAQFVSLLLFSVGLAFLAAMFLQKKKNNA